MDTFYVTDLLGDKIVRQERLDKVERALLQAIAKGEPGAAKAA